MLLVYVRVVAGIGLRSRLWCPSPAFANAMSFSTPPRSSTVVVVVVAMMAVSRIFTTWQLLPTVTGQLLFDGQWDRLLFSLPNDDCTHSYKISQGLACVEKYFMTLSLIRT